jgi:tRNA-Thr(GGU) m(6)t(6)A37 methyltransferase TsaA
LSIEDGVRSPMVLRPIAWVRNNVSEPGSHDWARVESDILFEPGLESALDGVEEFSHITVLFWMHRSPSWDSSMTKVHPQRRPDLPLVGVLATHSPLRPNPLGLTTVKLLERRDGVLRVAGLDAIDGTPVVDVKPFIPGNDLAQATAPEWVSKLRRHDKR